MTLAAFAKLALRMMAAGILFIYIPPKALFTITIIMPALISGSIRDTNSLLMVVICVVMIAASLIMWFQADRLALTLLPSDADPEQGVDYAQWQGWGLVFFGGWSALNACVAVENLIVDPLYAEGLLSLCFNVCVAVILITGWHKLEAIFSRNVQKA
ncbi:MAG: hypothetical protein WBQ60_05165 [Asticcacaulis sp.]